MVKTLSLSLFFIFIILIAFPLFNTNSSQTISLSDQKVIYELPYPGILPDNPLYSIKAVRDRLLDFFTRDNVKKAQLYLMYSDKRAHMAILLAKKGKEQLAITTLSKGEKYSAQIPGLLKSSKAQGVNPPDDLVFRSKLSNTKHREILDTFVKDFPQGEIQSLQGIMEMNDKTRKDLEGI